MDLDKEIVKELNEEGKGKHIMKRLEEGKRVTVNQVIEFCFIEEKIH